MKVVRTDREGHEIGHGKKFSICYRDEKLQDQPVADVHPVESYKAYNALIDD